MNTSKKFRPEIEGLRATAALLVAIYHIWLGRVSGGVDIFFVISGYLITTALLNRAAHTGKVRPFEFWAGLASRLLPSALFVLLCTGLASLVFLPKSLWLDTSKQIIASTLYLENWKLAFAAIDYLAREEPPSPVQHYWALSLQGQFYLVWPFVIAAALMVASRTRMSISSAFIACASVLFLTSLAFSIYFTKVDQPFAYFHTGARIWEFSMGGILAALTQSRMFERPSAVRHIMGWLGLVAILLCGIVLQVSTLFPGYAALWPTLAATFVLIAPRSGKLSVVRLLSHHRLVQLGSVSYALYLWHWPILIFYRHHTGVEVPTIAHGSAILISSIVLAWLTTRYIEAPLRNLAVRQSTTWRTFGITASLTVVVLTASYAWNWQVRQLSQSPLRTQLTPHNYPGALAGVHGATFKEVEPEPDIFHIRQDLPPSYNDGCHLKIEETLPVQCIYGDKESSKLIILVGGSHAVHWLPALIGVAIEEKWKILSFTKSGCLFTTEKQFLMSGQEYVECNEWNELVMSQIKDLKPAAVITTGTRVSKTGESIPAGYRERWAEIKRLNVSLILIRDTPYMPMDVPLCVDRHGPQHKKCIAKRREIFLATNPLTEFSEALSGNANVDMTEYFCDEESCPPTIGNLIVYHDSSHIGATFGKTLANPLRDKLRVAAPYLFSRLSANPTLLNKEIGK